MATAATNVSMAMKAVGDRSWSRDDKPTGSHVITTDEEWEEEEEEEEVECIDLPSEYHTTLTSNVITSVKRFNDAPVTRKEEEEEERKQAEVAMMMGSTTYAGHHNNNDDDDNKRTADNDAVKSDDDSSSNGSNENNVNIGIVKRNGTSASANHNNSNNNADDDDESNESIGEMKDSAAARKRKWSENRQDFNWELINASKDAQRGSPVDGDYDDDFDEDDDDDENGGGGGDCDAGKEQEEQEEQEQEQEQEEDDDDDDETEKCGDYEECYKRYENAGGKLRQEGNRYFVQDGDDDGGGGAAAAAAGGGGGGGSGGKDVKDDADDDDDDDGDDDDDDDDYTPIERTRGDDVTTGTSSHPGRDVFFPLGDEDDDDDVNKDKDNDDDDDDDDDFKHGAVDADKNEDGNEDDDDGDDDDDDGNRDGERDANELRQDEVGEIEFECENGKFSGRHFGRGVCYDDERVGKCENESAGEPDNREYIDDDDDVNEHEEHEQFGGSHGERNDEHKDGTDHEYVNEKVNYYEYEKVGKCDNEYYNECENERFDESENEIAHEYVNENINDYENEMTTKSDQEIVNDYDDKKVNDSDNEYYNDYKKGNGFNDYENGQFDASDDEKVNDFVNEADDENANEYENISFLCSHENKESTDLENAKHEEDLPDEICRKFDHNDDDDDDNNDGCDAEEEEEEGENNERFVDNDMKHGDDDDDDGDGGCDEDDEIMKRRNDVEEFKFSNTERGRGRVEGGTHDASSAMMECDDDDDDEDDDVEAAQVASDAAVKVVDANDGDGDCGYDCGYDCVYVGSDGGIDGKKMETEADDFRLSTESGSPCVATDRPPLSTPTITFTYDDDVINDDDDDDYLQPQSLPVGAEHQLPPHHYVCEDGAAEENDEEAEAEVEAGKTGKRTKGDREQPEERDEINRRALPEGQVFSTSPERPAASEPRGVPEGGPALTAFVRGICCTEPRQALEILRTNYKLKDVTRRSTKSIWINSEKPKKASGDAWVGDKEFFRSIDGRIYSGSNRLTEMRKRIEAREQRLNDLTRKIMEDRDRSIVNRSTKRKVASPSWAHDDDGGDRGGGVGGVGVSGEGSIPKESPFVSSGEEPKSFGQNLISRCDLSRADEITVIVEDATFEPLPKKAKTKKKKTNFFVKTFQSIRKKLYN